MKDSAGKPIQDKNGRFKLDGYALRNDKVGVEMYPAQVTNRYFTFTECAINNCDIVDKTSVAVDFLNKYMDETIGDEPQLSGDDTILQQARTASNGYLFTELYDDGSISRYSYDHSRADLALCSMLAYWTNGNAV